jgi:hypothetical protein
VYIDNVNEIIFNSDEKAKEGTEFYIKVLVINTYRINLDYLLPLGI